MPLARPADREHPSSSHAKWGALKFVVQPVMAKHADQPDKWTVSGIARSYASKEDAQQVRRFLKNNPPSHVKQALAQGHHVDDMLPGHLQRLPSWDDVHGTPAMKKENVMPDRIQDMLHLLGEHTEDCGCGKNEKIKFPPKTPTDRGGLARGIKRLRSMARTHRDPAVKMGASKSMHNLVRFAGGKGSRYEKDPTYQPPTKESFPFPAESTLFSGLALSEALERAKESLECGCIDKMDEANEALALALAEAGCPPMMHMNRKLGRCAKLDANLHQAVQDAHMQSRRSRSPEEHGRAHEKMQQTAHQLSQAGFHQLASLHAARAHAHKMASAN